MPSTPRPEPDDLRLFTPVPAQRVTANGWSAEVQRAFIMALSACGVVSAAARSVGRTASTAYRLRRRAGAEAFAAAWDRAAEEGRLRALDAAVAIGQEGREEPVFRRGVQVGVRRRYDDRLLLAALRTFDAMESHGRAIAPTRRTHRAGAPKADAPRSYEETLAARLGKPVAFLSFEEIMADLYPGVARAR